ncbi:MAG: hypothetical protein KDC24_08895 [Saprospiraceae bacterium]|nr:hypothetical protein [Saprospiraceae bacterium]
MRSKLQKFSQFAESLLPHEVAYLLSIENFEDAERLQILRRIDGFVRKMNPGHSYDEAIDKRKYSHLKNWIETRLEGIDVDVQFEWMSDMEREIMTDSIQPSGEKRLLKALKQYTPSSFYFTRFYDLLKMYRHFLLIRMRYNDHALVEAYLQENQEDYDRNVQILEKLHEATGDIVHHYSGRKSESHQWERWLNSVFYDEALDGSIRYMAFIRLAFMQFNYGNVDALVEPLNYLDEAFQDGQYYSGRILANYYNTRLMLHSRFGEYQKAMFYGYLSIRNKTHDYILYVNNLCAVLLRLGKNEEALELMKVASPEMKNTKNYHNKIGFVAFYMESLIKNDLFKNAENYGNTYLKAFENEILQHRWHLFFSVYFEALLHRNDFTKIFRLARKYKLVERDKAYENKANYLPTIPCLLEIAKYQSGSIREKELKQFLQTRLELMPTASTDRYVRLLSGINPILKKLGLGELKMDAKMNI